MTREEIVQGLFRGDGRAIKEAIKALEQEPCEDAVSRKAVFETIDDCNSDGLKGIFCSYDDGERFKKYIKNLPPATPARKKGKWIVLKDEYGDICEAICSCCEDHGNHRWKYCHTCGAEMESEE